MAKTAYKLHYYFSPPSLLPSLPPSLHASPHLSLSLFLSHSPPNMTRKMIVFKKKKKDEHLFSNFYIFSLPPFSQKQVEFSE